MTETQNIHVEPTLSSPFTDIVNTFMQKVQDDVCKNIVNAQISQITKFAGSCYNQKENQTQAESNKIDKTIKLSKNAGDQNFASAKTIHRAVGKAQQIQENPQWNFLQNIETGEISHTLRIQAQFSQIMKLFVQFARKQKLVMFQQTSSFITVKKGVSGSCRCFLKIWSSSEPDATVYQLRKYGNVNQRAKLILVEGDQIPFHAFYLSFLRLLNQKNLVKLLPGERVQLIFDQENIKILEYAESSEKLLQKLAKNKEVKIQELQLLTMNIKNQNVRLKEIIKQQLPNTENLPTLQKQIEDLCFVNSGIVPVFQQLYSKEYANYRTKRERILKKFNIGQIFTQLEIAEHYEQFKRQRSFKELELAEQKIPYILAIREMKRFANIGSISAALQSVVVFHQKIRVSYNNYFKNSFKIGDMDDFLPITIFCVLAVDCEQNILGIVKMLLSQFQACDEAEWQKKTLTDIEAAFEYILNEWKIE